MAVNVTFNGVTYSIPTEGDTDWGPDLSAYFVSLANNTLQKSGGNFFLTNELNFGPNFGLRGAYFRSSSTANPAAAGFIRLGNAQLIAWRNAANTADLSLQVDASDNLNFNGASLSVGGDPIQTELSFNDTDTIDLTEASGIVTAAIKAASIDDSLISATAGIAFSKMAALTASRVLVSSAGGVVTVSAVNPTELGYLAGVTSGVQAQIDSKLTKSSTASKIYGTDGVGAQVLYDLPLFPSVTPNRLYGIDGAGAQALYTVAQASTANAVAQRTTDQQLKALTVGDAHVSASSEDLTNRSYVQAAIAAVKAVVTVADLTARDAIPSGQRYEGMIVYVASEKADYQLQGGISNSNWADLGGALFKAITNITGNTTVTYDSGLLVINASADLTITLPAMALRKSIPFIRIDNNSAIVTFQCVGSDTIMGTATYTLPYQWMNGWLVGIATNLWGKFGA